MIGQQILEIIAATPDCREEHIYDGVFVDEHETHASIAALLAVGDVVALTREDGLTLYHLSDKFKASDAYKRIEMRLNVERDTPVGLPSIERAIEFVRVRTKKNREVTTSELHVLLELPPDALVSHHLADALADGRLIKDGKHWTIGAGTAVEEPKPALAIPQFVQPQADNVVPISSPRMARTKEPAKLDFAAFADMVNERPEHVKEVLSLSSGAGPVIRCGLWSDGAVELQRDGQTRALLLPDEMACLADFWPRIATNAKEAS
jgi:hypothetical protein